MPIDPGPLPSRAYIQRVDDAEYPLDEPVIPEGITSITFEFEAPLERPRVIPGEVIARSTEEGP